MNVDSIRFAQSVTPFPDRPALVLGDDLMHDGDFLISHSSHAAPLMPLRDRDLKVLVDLFAQDEIDDIETDILHNLMRRAPEPCWEDEALDFLEEYL